MANIKNEFIDNPNVLIFTNLDDIGQPYSCNQWGNRHTQYGSDNPIITNDSGSTIWNWFRTGAYVPSYAWIDHNMTVHHKSNYINQGSYRINQMLDNCGSLCLGEPILGCTDIQACNYNESAEEDDGTCDYETCLGCTDFLANNYDSEATIDDGSCTYPINVTFGSISSSSIEINLENEYAIQGFQFTVTDNPDQITITGASGGRSEDSNFEVTTSTLGIVIGFSFTGDLIQPGSGLLTTLSYEGVGPTDICFQDVVFSDSNANSIGVGSADCLLLDILANPGDTNLDNQVNVQDIVILINFILGFNEPNSQQLLNGDMDENGFLNVLDVIRVVNQILGTAISYDRNDIKSGIINYEYVNDNLVLTISSENDFSGIQLMINSIHNHDIELKDNSHITIKQNYRNQQKIVLAYSMFNDSFDGHKAEFKIFNAKTLNIEDIDVIVSNTSGNEIQMIYNQVQSDFNYTFDINSIYPNPFNPSTDIDFTLDKDSYVKLSVFNIKGQEVDVVFEGFQEYGNHSYTWNANNFASGIYYFNLKANDSIAIKKAMLIK